MNKINFYFLYIMRANHLHHNFQRLLLLPSLLRLFCVLPFLLVLLEQLPLAVWLFLFPFDASFLAVAGLIFLFLFFSVVLIRFFGVLVQLNDF